MIICCYLLDGMVLLEILIS